MRRLRIALVSTSAVRVPPSAYGGTEAFVASLAAALVEAGHEVHTYATGDSRVPGTLHWHFPEAVWPADSAAERAHAGFAASDVARFHPDVVQLNSPEALAAFAASAAPIVATVHHARVESLVECYQAHPRARLVAISRRQAETMPELDFAAVIHHGLDATLFPAGDGRGGYCAFLGRMSPDKAPHAAIDAARRAGVPLIVAGPHRPGRPHYDRYFDRELGPRLAVDDSIVSWVGELCFEPKLRLLRDAGVLLFPMGWEEPFGLVMIEAMLVGTPVVAFARGSAPEIVEDGVTGFLVRDSDAMADRIHAALALDRVRCRERAIERFGAPRMADEYVSLYRDILASRDGRRVAGRGLQRRTRRSRTGISPSSAGADSVARRASHQG